MTIPSSVVILGRVYNIDQKDFIDGDLLGQCDSDALKITIKKNQPAILEADTLLHEILHAIDDAMQTKMKERQVHCTATGLLALFKDNPDFVKYMFKVVK
jgi:hypothetical protein